MQPNLSCSLEEPKNPRWRFEGERRKIRRFDCSMNSLSRTIFLASGIALGWVRNGSPAESAPRQRVDFQRDIQPILERRCYECHGPNKQKNGVRFDRKATVFNGGDSGKPLILAGHNSESPLIQRVTASDPDEVMPKKGERLTEAQVTLLKQWIDEGAPWPEAASQEKKHWAYISPVRSPLPKVRNVSWPRN